MVAMAGLHHVRAARFRLGRWVLDGDGPGVARRRLRWLGRARGRFVGQKQLGHLVILAVPAATLWVAVDRSGAAGVCPGAPRPALQEHDPRRAWRPGPGVDDCRLTPGRRAL